MRNVIWKVNDQSIWGGGGWGVKLIFVFCIVVFFPFKNIYGELILIVRDMLDQC